MKLVEFEPSNLCVHERQADPVIAVQPHTLRTQCVQLLPGENHSKSLLFTQDVLMEFSVKCYLSLKCCNAFIRELSVSMFPSKNLNCHSLNTQTYVEDGGHCDVVIDASFRSSSHGQTDKPHAGNPELIMRGRQFL